MNDEICRMSAVDLLAAYDAGDLSPVQATEAVLERIHERNDAYNAFCLIDDEGAMAAARRSEKRWLAGAPEGRIDGVPVSVKDLVLAEGLPTMRGSKTTPRDQPWDEEHADDHRPPR